MALCELHYFSDALGMQTGANVLLPDHKIAGPYHVMFLLHGLSDDYTMWTRRSSIERYLEGVPLIVVMPDGGRGWYVDAEEGFAYGTAISKELPDVIRSYFPTKENWAITGLSMGGYGALRLALGDPTTFVSAVSHSGAMGIGHRWDKVSDTVQPEFQRIFGEDITGGPNDLYALAKQKNLPALRIDCGVDDFLIEENRAYHAHLEKLDVAHEYHEFPGSHTWDYWDTHVQEAIQFHCKVLGIETLPVSFR